MTFKQLTEKYPDWNWDEVVEIPDEDIEAAVTKYNEISNEYKIVPNGVERNTQSCDILTEAN
jgi:hypothetical protein